MLGAEAWNTQAEQEKRVESKPQTPLQNRRVAAAPANKPAKTPADGAVRGGCQREGECAKAQPREAASLALPRKRRGQRLRGKEALPSRALLLYARGAAARAARLKPRGRQRRCPGQCGAGARPPQQTSEIIPAPGGRQRPGRTVKGCRRCRDLKLLDRRSPDRRQSRSRAGCGPELGDLLRQLAGIGR